MTIVMRPTCWHQNFGPNGLSAPAQGLCLNVFSSITADFNISSAIRWAIQDQWSSGFIILAELALHTVWLLGQLVLCTYALFGTLKIHYACSRLVMALDSGSEVRGLKVDKKAMIRNRYNRPKHQTGKGHLQLRRHEKNNKKKKTTKKQKKKKNKQPKRKAKGTALSQQMATRLS